MRKFLYSIFGFLNGYLMLHPISMVLFMRLAKHGDVNSPNQGILPIIMSSFGLTMLPMALGFGLLGIAVSLVYEGQSNKLAGERNRLRWEVARGRALMDELEYRAQQLTTQKQKLLDLQRMRERTIAFLVHDFKNQLGCILGFSDILLERPMVRDDPNMRSLLGRVHRQATAMTIGVRNLLDIVRLEEKPTLKKELFDPESLLQSVAKNDYAPSAEYAINITPESRSCPSVFAERDLIMRVLVNLVRNAVKHQRPGVQITLSAEPDTVKQTVVFGCDDDGEPILSEVRTHLFTAHRTGENTPADSTGLGLAFGKAAVEAHGGRIWHVGSQKDGNSFRFTVPVERSEEMKDEKKQNVLVVEDDPDFAALMKSTLKGFGFEVRIALNADDAMAKLENTSTDLITLDIQMPNKSGLLFYQQIKTHEDWRNIPVIVISGLAEEDSEWRKFMTAYLKGEQMPAPQAYLKKPINKDDLGFTIRRVFRDYTARS